MDVIMITMLIYIGAWIVLFPIAAAIDNLRGVK
jgi:hypothetical protein